LSDGKGSVFARCPYVQCDNNKCSFCRSLFVNLQLTKCVGHSRCSKSRWYPHVGEQLWKGLIKYHKQPNALFKPPENRILKDNQLESYCEYNSKLTSSTPAHSPVMDFEDDSDSCSTVTSSSSQSKRKLESSQNWCDEVEIASNSDPRRIARVKKAKSSASAKAAGST